MLEYQKTMFDRVFVCFFCIKSFCHLKTLEKTLRKVHFCITLMVRKRMNDSVLPKTCFRAKTYVILTSLNNLRLYERYC